jgi:serine protease AprX
MAAPVVAGAIAVLLEKQPSLTPAQIKQRLVSTVTSLAPIPAVSAGAGLLNVPAALASLDTSKAKAKGRVTDAFAKDMRKFIQGQAFPWRDVTFNGGVDSHNVTWDNVTWDNVTWDNVTWDNISWENFTWENVTWDNVTWDNVTWDSLDTLSTTTQSIAWTTAD